MKNNSFPPKKSPEKPTKVLPKSSFVTKRFFCQFFLLAKKLPFCCFSRNPCEDRWEPLGALPPTQPPPPPCPLLKQCGSPPLPSLRAPCARPEPLRRRQASSRTAPLPSPGSSWLYYEGMRVNLPADWARPGGLLQHPPRGGGGFYSGPPTAFPTLGTPIDPASRWAQPGGLKGERYWVRNGRPSWIVVPVVPISPRPPPPPAARPRHRARPVRSPPAVRIPKIRDQSLPDNAPPSISPALCMSHLPRYKGPRLCFWSEVSKTSEAGRGEALYILGGGSVYLGSNASKIKRYSMVSKIYNFRFPNNPKSVGSRKFLLCRLVLIELLPGGGYILGNNKGPRGSALY